MLQHEAMACVAYLQASFPTPEIPSATATLWARDLLRFDDPADVREAIDLVRGVSMSRPVNIGDIVIEAQRVRRVRLDKERGAIARALSERPDEGPYTTFVEFLAADPEYRARVDALYAKGGGRALKRLEGAE
jgi:HEAT repeat protein